MITNKNTLVVETKKEQRSVSICEEKMVIEHSKTRLDVDRKESSASFLNPALSFARRMSLKITGSRGEREERQEGTTMNNILQMLVMGIAEPGGHPGIILFWIIIIIIIGQVSALGHR